MQRCQNNGGGGGSSITTVAVGELGWPDDDDDQAALTLPLKLPDDDDPGCAGDIDQATDSETLTELFSESLTPTLRLQLLQTDNTKRADDNCFEQIWRDGNLHWGERHGDGWVEHWQTQEGLLTRFGTKRGRDLKNEREWQERWDETGNVMRIEKRVTQSEEGEELERWIERVEISGDIVRETCIGEDRSNHRQWRLYAVFKLDEANVKHLQSKKLEEIWSDERETSAESYSTLTNTRRRVEETSVQPGGRVLRLHTKLFDEANDEVLEENKYQDRVTGSQWGSKHRETKEAIFLNEWNNDATTGSHERRETILRKNKTVGLVASFNPSTNETYRENWGKEKLSDRCHTEWSSKWRQRDAQPWGDYFEKIETFDSDSQSTVLKEEQRNEKWWFENDERFSEHWTVIEERKENQTTRITRTGHNEYGPTATEDWEEIYEVVKDKDNPATSPTPTLHHKRIEKDNLKLRTIEEFDLEGEHHVVEDKELGQTDVWHVNKRTGAKWGNKHGSNSTGVFWHEEWSESENEHWLEKRWKDDAHEWGERSGFKNASKETWSEKWSEEGGGRWSERFETDAEGNTINRRSGASLRPDGTLTSQFTDSYGETLTGEKWAHKQGYDELKGDWEEKWNERRDHKSAEKRGRDYHKGQSWFEAWSEEYDWQTGNRIKQTATKEGTSSRTGESWLETWTEEGPEKYARKSGRSGEQEWREEWREEGDGAMWCRKWATNGQTEWGESWQDDLAGNQHGVSYQDGHIVHTWSRLKGD